MYGGRTAISIVPMTRVFYRLRLVAAPSAW